MTYDLVEHTADVGFVAVNSSLEGVFTDSARALFSVMYEGIDIVGEHVRRFRVEASDLIGLLRAFLEEFIFLLEGEGVVVAEVVDIGILHHDDGYSLDCTILFAPISNYSLSNAVKSVTYHGMRVEQKNHMWTAEGVFDV